MNNNWVKILCVSVFFGAALSVNAAGYEPCTYELSVRLWNVVERLSKIDAKASKANLERTHNLHRVMDRLLRQGACPEELIESAPAGTPLSKAYEKLAGLFRREVSCREDIPGSYDIPQGYGTEEGYDDKDSGNAYMHINWISTKMLKAKHYEWVFLRAQIAYWQAIIIIFEENVRSRGA